MEPSIWPGQAVLASSIPFLFSKPMVGDIVAFRVFDKVYIKRIVQEEGDKYIIIGDNKNDSTDSRDLGWIDKDDILGKVIYKIKNP
jgi:signal peptidase I